MANGCNSLPWTFPSSFLHVCIDTNSSFIWDTSLWGEAAQHVITHLLACFAIIGTLNSIKTDNGPAYTSRQFKQFLQSFSIKHITDIPYNPQAQGIVEWAHHTLKLQIKKFKKREFTGTLLSSLSRADFTRLLPGKSHGQRSLASCSPWGRRSQTQLSN